MQITKSTTYTAVLTAEELDTVLFSVNYTLNDNPCSPAPKTRRMLVELKAAK